VLPVMTYPQAALEKDTMNKSRRPLTLIVGTPLSKAAVREGGITFAPTRSEPI